jgi:hypothetical protein
MTTSKVFLTAILAVMLLFLTACGPMSDTRTADQKQAANQETILQEGNAQTGMPNIKNFRERKLLKDILEMRDQNGLVTYTYLFSEQTAKICFLGNTVGYGIPYATQYTSPQRPAKYNEAQMAGNLALPQADPNGLFSPAAAEGTWILMKDPRGGEVRPAYIEPRIMTFTFRLEGAEPCVPGMVR